MRVLLVRHAADGLRARIERRDGVARRDPRIHLRQHVPLHRLSCHRRCGGSRDRGGGGRTDGRADAASATGIGARIPRRELKRLLSGHGRYIDDIKLPRMLHACFVRSPHPHAKVVSIDVAAAKKAPGVAAVFTAADINPKCEPFVGVALHRPGHRSAPQHLLAAERAVWQGQPVGHRGRREPRRSRGRGRACRDRMAALARGRRPDAGDRAGRAGHPCRARRQRRLRFFAGEGPADQGLRRSRHRHRGGASLRAADGDDARDARADRRFQSGRRLAHRHPRAPVAVPDAGDLQPAPENSRAQDPRDRARHRRRLRHEAQHLFRRDRDRGGEHAARPAGQVLRRPA